jgi:hypothetical protein
MDPITTFPGTIT